MSPSRRSAVAPFEVMDVVAEAMRRRAEGLESYLLCVGEPSGGAPADVRAAAERALADPAGIAHAYTQPSGLPALREEIAGHYDRWYGVAVDPADVVVTTGASSAFQVAAVAAFDHGDRVAVPAPGYPAYRNLLAALGCEVVDVDAGAACGYRLTVAALAEQHARRPLAGVVLASPANPTGTMVDAVAMAALTRWCAENGVVLVSDEIYHGLTYTGSRGEPALAHTREALTVGSFSKYWGMTAWRLGWIVLPRALRAAGEALAGNLQLCAPSLAQVAALRAFTPGSYAECDARRDALHVARDAVVARGPALGWRDVAPPDGAFYLWADVSGSGLDSRTYCARLLEATGVALAPGTDFDPVAGSSHVRLSFSPGAEVVARACDRIADWSA
ncbi:pyridoxal phosphate-dependent aminotransferase [Miniimonas arenae]|uniref:pyridoxal phosphate-dependent aminotransferase n=1 Tax=Miniimonas arenae TaxID=676201 RepID=UPI0028B20C8C|nr:aminotransferase class I/II-fold pyridoxal phosphate-dependent enzyme [Miniimonas arenae]